MLFISQEPLPNPPRPEKLMAHHCFIWLIHPKYLKPDLKTHAFLHISLIPAIFKDTYGIIHSPDPFIQKYPMIKLSVLSNESTLRISDHAARQLIRFGGALWKEKSLPFNRALWDGVHKLSGIRCSAIRIRYYNSFGTL